MKRLLSPKPSTIGQPVGSHPEPDAAPSSLRHGSDAKLLSELEALLGKDQVLGRASDLIAYASDASPYRRIPAVVVQPRSEADISALMRYAKKHHRTMTFRAAGTSLNGQAATEDILVDLKRHFTGMRVLNQGAQLWARPGVILGDAQAVLARSGVMLGPDPGSTAVATIGGVLANNAGGMRCSVERDSYHSVASMRVVLPSGNIVDTSESDETFAAKEPALHAALVRIRDEIRSDEALCKLLKKKFSIRNTNGIRLDAFIDEESPVRILNKLMISSEGIFGAITEATINTVALPKHKAMAWVMLPDLRDAARFVAPIMQAGALACELLVAPVMQKAVGNFPAADPAWADLPPQAAALLVELGGRDAEELEACIAATTEALEGAELLSPLNFERSEAAMRGAWQIRNGLFGLLGSNRPQGTAMITEDVCFPPEQVGDGAADLLDLLAEFGYPEMVMGHAAFGNLHFFLLPNLAQQEDRERYAEFLDRMSAIVIDKYQGSLKAEHGTGVNMAPFLLREWGQRAWDLMWEVKEAIDPAGVLAPDIKLTRNQHLHLEHFKSLPKVEDEINDCVECGFCEPVCPSRDVTITPRQRIVLRREMARQAPGSPLLATLQEQFQYDGIDMCAADSSCAIACPVSIDTGKVMKQFRQAQASPIAAKTALSGAKKWAVVEQLVRGGLVSAKVLGSPTLDLAARIGRNVINPDVLPSVPGPLPLPAQALPHTTAEGATAVYFPACINRMFGNSAEANPEHLPLPRAVVELGRRAGAPVWIPEDVAGDCCGTPWSSKGYKEGFEYQARTLALDLLRWSDEGRLPVIVDAASCTHGMITQMQDVLEPSLRKRLAAVEILDVVEWLHRTVIEHLPIVEDFGRIAVHPTCSVQHMQQSEMLLAVANRCGQAVVPEGAGCCGSAGDRVMLHPELSKSATQAEAEALEAGNFDAFVASNRTCEMGLEMVCGQVFEHVAVLLERASRPVVSP
ncbi:FAD-binding and (Fe-S)-binding domain-containing protein [Corynebacterium pelargi]|uniref:D-lactate dehydrogenase (cytochrome) n=1 Tax=Corynebacterium pelargi TaxID=1471400 RepID=A0A410W8Z0_9CORY|nr:FAD-binding and (Fe-S)-binding domain-containing protein [Corynebacterium pelargi]QAU52408.1 putative FAD-linked oxidoreductase [Corynebacterium pelargi]GGG67898.1 oxidoreductase [Corynebacterium pelargi]